MHLICNMLVSHPISSSGTLWVSVSSDYLSLDSDTLILTCQKLVIYLYTCTFLVILSLSFNTQAKAKTLVPSAVVSGSIVTPEWLAWFCNDDEAMSVHSVKYKGYAINIQSAWKFWLLTYNVPQYTTMLLTALYFPGKVRGEWAWAGQENWFYQEKKYSSWEAIQRNWERQATLCLTVVLNFWLFCVL